MIVDSSAILAILLAEPETKAKLNLCNCAAYALARTMSAPLLFKGDDFPHTDIAAAV